MNEPIHEGQNTGIIEIMPRLGDFVASGESAIVRKVVNPSGDWTAYFPPGEWQKDLPSGLETDACVSFSHADALETYANFAIANSLWPAETIQFLRTNGYFNADNKTINFSDRFLARMSNTTTNGNSLPNVGDAVRKFGLVPESAWPFPIDAVRANPGDAWNIYYADVPASVQAIGQEFLRHLKPQYEWVKYPGSSSNLHFELTVSPLQIATAVCWPWNTDQTIQACGPGAAHGTMLGKIETDGRDTILDHYVPFTKHFSPDYDITYAMRCMLTPIAQLPTPPATFHYTFTKQLTYKGTNDPTELHALQTALQTLKRSNGAPYMTPGLYGIFGDATRTALDLFERDHHIPDPQPGCNFGPMNRAAMNAALNT